MYFETLQTLSGVTKLKIINRRHIVVVTATDYFNHYPSWILMSLHPDTRHMTRLQTECGTFHTVCHHEPYDNSKSSSDNHLNIHVASC